MFGGISDIFGGAQRRATPQRGRDLESEINLTFHEAVNGVTRTLNVDGPGGRRDVTFEIPPGIKNGALIRLQRKGGAGVNGGKPGDLHVRVHTAKHPIFHRDGKGLEVRVPITFAEAALGANISVPTLDGKVTLKIPAGTSSGKKFRVAGKGIAGGDLLVTVDVQVPHDLSPEKRKLVEQIRDLDGEDTRSHLGV